MLNAYHTAIDELVQSGPSPEATLVHWQEWRDCFQVVIAENRQSVAIGDAKWQLLGLYNGLGEHDKSQALLQEMISEASSPDQKIELYDQLEAFCRMRYQDTQDASYLQKAQEAFERAKELRITDDPIAAVLEAYQMSVDEFRAQEDPSSVARLTHYQEWRDRFLEIVAENPQSEFVAHARRQLVALYNGLEEYDKSQALLREMITGASTPEGEIELHNQLGTISRMRYWGSQDEKFLQESLDAFEQANVLYLSLPPERQGGVVGGRQIRAIFTTGTLARDQNDHEKAATLFRTARELFQSLPGSAMHVASVYFNLETIAEQEMIQWIHLRREGDALSCLRILSDLPTYRWPPSYYALQYATQWYGGNSAGFQNFVSNWLDKNTFDERTPILMARLGFSYFDNGLYEKVLPIHETLRDKYRGDFQRLEPVAFQQGNGGHYERILYHLSVIYSQGNDRGKADSVRTEMLNLFPESARVKFLVEPNSSWDGSEFVVPERGQYFVLRVCLTVLGAMMILLGLYIAWRKKT
jgi:tetratricopeptide (TPR) repeat protein